MTQSGSEVWRIRETLYDMFNLYSVEERQSIFEGDHGYDVFYSAMDALHDTGTALLEVNRRNGGDVPLLSNMGLLLAIRIQQDAYFNLGRVLNANLEAISFKNCQLGKSIRETANRVAHPLFSEGHDRIATFFPAGRPNSQGLELAFYGAETIGQFLEYDQLLANHEASILRIKEPLLTAGEKKELELHLRNPIEYMYERGTNEPYRKFKSRID